MKKLIAVLLCLGMLLLCACGTPAESPETSTVGSSTEESQFPTSAPPPIPAYTDFAKAQINGEGGFTFFAGRTQQDVWEEIYRPEDIDAALLFSYRNRLYFADMYGLGYVDLSKDEPERISWIDYDTPQIANPIVVSGGVLVDDTLYYDWNHRPDSGIFAIPMAASSFEEAEEILPDAGFFWQIDAQSGIIYHKPVFQNGVCSYDIRTKESKTLLDDSRDFSVNQDGNILYYDSADGFRIFLYNSGSGESTLIHTKTGTNLSGTLWDLAEYHMGKIYYRDDNTLYRYDDGESTALYTVKDPYVNDGSPYMYGFSHISDNIMRITVQESDAVYLVDDQEAPAPTYTFRLKDGATLQHDAKHCSVDLLSLNRHALTP